MIKRERKNLIILVSVLVILAIAFGIYWVQLLHKAHSTFENYYAFRGCARLLEKKNDYGICKTSSGETIKIVKYQNKWYLDGDLPVCDFGICF